MSEKIKTEILEELDCDTEFEAGSGYIEYADYGPITKVILTIYEMICDGVIGADFDYIHDGNDGAWFYRVGA
tara:strand:- start:397 stop:612 length:216 start_codon:yes stop_codon:yes gene_type:complete